MITTSPAAPKPAHIPDAAAFDFDMFRDPGLLTDPHERIRELLRIAPPVFWTPRNRGHWMTIGYAASLEASRDPSRFSNVLFTEEQRRAILSRLPEGSRRIPEYYPIATDPPLHRKYRGPLEKVFSPKAAAALKAD